MIKWKYKPSGQCPVQAEGWFLNHYFYFRSRWSRATIEFAYSEKAWERNSLEAFYVLKQTQAPKAGWFSHKLCYWLIIWGCFLFLIGKK